MNLTKTIKQFIPPILIDLYRNYTNGFNGGQFWKGIYARYQDVPTQGESYFSKTLAREAYDATKILLQSSKRNPTGIPFHVAEENTYLPLLVSVVAVERKNDITILDLGGGTGVGFISTVSCLPGDIGLSYYVIETPAMCEQGTELFKDDNRIRFLPDFPDKLHVDIVFVNSALQYFENYREVLTRLCSYAPEYILLVKFSAGPFNTFATLQQNLNGTTSPYWFLGLSEINELFLSLGYSLIYKSALARHYNQDNFPETHRMGQACNLLFGKLSRLRAH
jgi:putative methyltransferase (TIGR04325 family)